jgi:GNAT superfamily N-acetyltransferase
MKIRKGNERDFQAVVSISRSTWEGEDYLEKMAMEWIADETLFVAEEAEKVIGTYRISPMPEGVLWLEALRIHSDFRGRGLGRLLADDAFARGRAAMKAGDARCLEFSTYINNSESIHISLSQGFRIVNRYLLLTLPDPEQECQPVEFNPAHCDFDELHQHIPCGWKYPRLCPEGIDWAREYCEFFRWGGISMLRKRDSNEATPLRGGRLKPEEFLRTAEAVAAARGEDESCIVLHVWDSEVISAALDRGYSSWEPVDECNVLILRYDG